MTDQPEIRRHVARLVPRLELTKSERREVVAVMDRYLTDKRSIVRTCAMQALADVARKDGVLKTGIVKQLQKLADEGTPAMRARGRKLLAKLVE
jgi:hypothetical protein